MKRLRLFVLAAAAFAVVSVCVSLAHAQSSQHMAATRHVFCLHHRDSRTGASLSLCTWARSPGIGVAGSLALRNVTVSSFGVARVGNTPIMVSQRLAGVHRNTTLPVIGTEQAFADHVAYHLELGNPFNAYALVETNACRPNCASSPWQWSLVPDTPASSHGTRLFPAR